MNALVPASQNNALVGFGDIPDWYKDDPAQKTGLENLGSKDYKIPRVILLQALNPECRQFPGQAIPGYFWHTGANVSLGQKFNMVSAVVNKRVVLFRPRNMGGGVLAISNDAQRWDNGGGKKFVVTPINNDPRQVTWDTGKDVHSSGLLGFGSSFPENDQSPPAATLFYEYLVFLPDYPQLSPVLYSMSKTALPSARALNSTYAMLKKPIAMARIEITATEKTENNNTWYVPTARGNGFVDKTLFDAVTLVGKNFGDYKAEYEEDYAPEKPVAAGASKDEIPF